MQIVLTKPEKCVRVTVVVTHVSEMVILLYAFEEHISTVILAAQ